MATEEVEVVVQLVEEGQVSPQGVVVVGVLEK